jgi:hypothetical protein
MASSMTDQHMQAVVDEHPAMRWGAVFAGWFVATGIALVLYAFGLALGLSALDPHNATAVTHGLPTGAAVLRKYARHRAASLGQ